MNKIKKNITVRFFSINASDSFFHDFKNNHSISTQGDHHSRMVSKRNTKYLIQAIKDNELPYVISAVKERNTWQTKATRDGEITGVSTNQGIIGDPHYFCVIPDEKIIFGFTTGPSGSLKSVAKFSLEQFNSDRFGKITLSLIPKEKEFAQLMELPEYNSLHFKINSSSLADLSDTAPTLIKNLGAAPYIGNNTQLALDLECSDNPESILTKKSLIEIVNYLSENDACTILNVKGINDDGKRVSLDFANAFINFKTVLMLRNKYVDKKNSLKVLKQAFESI